MVMQAKKLHFKFDSNFISQIFTTIHLELVGIRSVNGPLRHKMYLQNFGIEYRKYIAELRKTYQIYTVQSLLR